MRHYTYWIIDRKNGMYYHGVHSSENPEDIAAYHGSSRALKAAIKKHGIEHFEKRVEREFPSREEAVAWEAKVHARLDVAGHAKFYNLANGHSRMGYRITQEHMRNLHSPEAREKMAAAKLGRKRGPMSEEHRRKISESRKGKPLSAAHRKALAGVPKNLTKERRLELREAAALARRAAIRAALARGGYVIERGGESFYVLKVTAFARSQGIPPGLTYKIAAIIKGREKSAFGCVPRRPTEEEDRAYRHLAVQEVDQYVKMGSN